MIVALAVTRDGMPVRSWVLPQLAAELDRLAVREADILKLPVRC
jgi:hypothetical protein